eukprot:GHVU01201223.1.p2 GENE.GHVU01201223.1~~GHVU01201223.1.p2  ORF type:complete len:116 (+),score=11.21 GHVU01201223.1:1-348(+)
MHTDTDGVEPEPVIAIPIVPHVQPVTLASVTEEQQGEEPQEDSAPAIAVTAEVGDDTTPMPQTSQVSPVFHKVSRRQTRAHTTPAAMEQEAVKASALPPYVAGRREDESDSEEDL